MTEAELAKHFAQDSISLATSMTNPQAESIAMFSCLHVLTFKKKEIEEMFMDLHLFLKLEIAAVGGKNNLM